jgi:hypothetical protein
MEDWFSLIGYSVIGSVIGGGIKAFMIQLDADKNIAILKKRLLKWDQDIEEIERTTKRRGKPK